MNQFQLGLLWRLNRGIIARGLTLADISCTADNDDEVINLRGRIWRRAAGTRPWEPMKPLHGNLVT